VFRTKHPPSYMAFHDGRDLRAPYLDAQRTVTFVLRSNRTGTEGLLSEIRKQSGP